ncbi:testis-specific serine/threonine-protein kinase 1-like [Acanthaster planci]|uniref:Testis-specific serine/threonine-protein kinase 1-like n=1 Tax=Acanthaster planci TaxID=133434 RepID=A0A8B7YQF6_ACAPL|nr:testis-specific serine/threonine-protein kinase 1-like [Acanthaster planci]
MGNERIFYTDEALHLKRKGEGVWMPEKGKSVLDSLQLDLVDKGIIGEGPYSQVRKVYSRKLNRYFAFKRISKLRAPKEAVDKFLPREITIMQQLAHERLVDMEAVLVTEHYTFILMEYIPHGDLTNYINRRGHLCEEEARMLFHQLLDAVSYLHALDVVHRDIKCDNIMLDEHYNVKLGDFGFATMCEAGQKLSEFCGSYAYTAPEVLAGEAYGGKKADVWSMGVVLYAMLCGRLPYHDETLDILIDNIHNPQGKLLFHKKVSKDCRDFVRSMLTADPKARASISKLKRMDWLNKPIDMSSADYKTPQSSFESVGPAPAGGRPRRASLDMNAEHGFFESQRVMENEKQRPHTVTDVLRAVAVRHAFGESTTDIHKHVGLRPGTHLKATDVGLTGPAGRRISVQLSQQNLPLFAGGVTNKPVDTPESTRRARRASLMPDRKDSLSMLTSTARKGIRRGSLAPYQGALRATGSQIMMSNEDLMASAINLNQTKVNKEIHDMHYYTGAKVARAAGAKRHKSAECTRRNSVFTDALKLRSQPNALDPAEQALVNLFRSKCEKIKDMVA